MAIPLKGTPQDIDELLQGVAMEFNELIDPELSFSVQSRVFPKDYPLKPFDINTPIADFIHESTDAPLDVRAPTNFVGGDCPKSASCLSGSLANHAQYFRLGGGAAF